MESKTTRAFVISMLFVATLNAWAQTPTKLSELVIYNGAKLIQEELAPSESGILSGVRRTYAIAAAPEAVVAFYEKIIGIKARFLDPEDENKLAVGKSTAATSQVYYWNDEEFVDADFGAGGSSKRAWIKKALQSRAKDRNEGWVESANMQWYYRQSADSMVAIQIMVQDLSIDEESGQYALATELIVEFLHFDYEP